MKRNKSGARTGERDVFEGRSKGVTTDDLAEGENYDERRESGPTDKKRK